MDKFALLLGLSMIALVSGCSGETAKRTAYETLQNVREQECLNYPSASDCVKRGSYDDYQRQRKELEKAPD